MKNLLYFILLIFASCSTVPLKMTTDESSKLSSSNDTIYYAGSAIAYIDHLEWEYYRGDIRIEISMVQIDTRPENTILLMKYVHLKHPNSKVEVTLKK